MQALRPLIISQARAFASKCGDIDNTAFEDVAYWEIYRYYTEIISSNGNFDFVLAKMKFSAIRAMKKLKKGKPPWKHIFGDDAINNCYAGEKGLDGIKIANYIMSYDKRLGSLLKAYLNGKEFNCYGDKAYFYRKIHSYIVNRHSFGNMSFLISRIFERT